MAKISFSLVGVIALGAVFFLSAAFILVSPFQPQLAPSELSKPPTVYIKLYGDEISSGKYGFGDTPNSLTSPGPTLRFKTTDIVEITFVNLGSKPHAFAMVYQPKTGATALFGAIIGSASNPIQPGQSGSVTFKATTPSDLYYYVSPVSGDPETGMYGSCIISQG